MGLELKTEYDGEQITHRLLWTITKEQAEEGLRREAGWFNPSVIARVFAFHTIEAHLNYVGERIAPEIWANERQYFRKEPYRGVEGKLRKVMELVGLPWTPEQRPLHTVLELKELRDLIAHGKAERLQGTVLHGHDENAPYPVSKLRELAGPKETLARVLPDVEEFLDAVQARAKPLLKEPDVWFGNMALKGPPWYMGSSTTLNR